MPNIHFTPSHGKGPHDDFVNSDRDIPTVESFALPQHAKEAKLPEDAQAMRKTLEQHAIPGPLKEVLHKRSKLDQSLLSLGVAIGSTEAIAQIPQAVAKALKKYAS